MGYDPVSVYTYGELLLGKVAFNDHKAVPGLKQTFEDGKMCLLGLV